ncbi:HNH endonuclease signature motif containing protein [Planctomicrobium sp. SH661]|uniref:HNH endonuclease signature motif containing protein n=1 Tax=Planctomicrobium sp. SH661 TaxID=3448124 RepID=UPI003F5BF2A5
MPTKAERMTSRGMAATRARQIHPSRTEKAGRSWYQSATWKQLRREHLGEHPHCVECLKSGRPASQSPGNVVDHIKPHRGNWELFSSPQNLQTLCSRHHSQKTCREDGGFGHERKSSTHRKPS